MWPRLAGPQGIALALAGFLATGVGILPHVAAFPVDGLKLGGEAVAEFYLDELPEGNYQLPSDGDDDDVAQYLSRRNAAWDNDCINPESQRQDNMGWNRLKNASLPHNDTGRPADPKGVNSSSRWTTAGATPCCRSGTGAATHT